MATHLLRLVAFSLIVALSGICLAETITRESFLSRKNGDLLTLPVEIASKYYTFLLDTGSEVTFVDSRLQDILEKCDSDFDVSDGYSSTKAAAYILPRGAKIGRSISLDDVPFVLCRDFTHLRNAFGVDFDGVIGCDCLQDKRLQIDFDLGRVRFFDRIDDKDHGLGEEVQLSITQHGVPAIPIMLGRGLGTPFVVDTGAVGIQVQCEKSRYESLEKASELRTERTTRLRSINETTLEHSGLVDSASLGRFRFRHLEVQTGPYDFVGLDFLSQFSVTLSFPEGKAFLRPATKFWQGPDRNLSGAKFTRVNGAYQVLDVEANSFASSAGLQIGDAITQVNGVDTSRISLFEMRSKFARENRQVVMHIERAGKAKLLTLVIGRGETDHRWARQDRRAMWVK